MNGSEKQGVGGLAAVDANGSEVDEESLDGSHGGSHDGSNDRSNGGSRDGSHDRSNGGSHGGSQDGSQDGSEDGDGDNEEEEVGNDVEENEEEDEEDAESESDVDDGVAPIAAVGAAPAPAAIGAALAPAALGAAPAPAALVAAGGNTQQGNWFTYEEMMSETYPSKSKEVYLSAYRCFELFLKSENQFAINVVPTELMMLNYFRYLRNVKKWQSTTIWSQYSRLNGVLKRRFGLSMKTFPSVTDLLKSFEVGHRVKKASVFTPQQEIFLFFTCHQ